MLNWRAGPNRILSSIFQVVTRTGHHAFRVELLDGGVNGAVQLGCVPKRLMGQVVSLEVAPGALDCVSMMPLYVGFLVRARCDAALI